MLKDNRTFEVANTEAKFAWIMSSHAKRLILMNYKLLNCEKMKVSLFKENYLAPQTLQLSILMERIQSKKHAGKVTGFREYLRQVLPGDRCPEDKKPPLVLFASLFGGKENPRQWIAYSGLVVVEVNELTGRKEAETIRDRAAQCMPTMTTFVGSGGRSVKIVTRFTCPDGSLPLARREAELFHAHAYRRAASFYRLELDREISWKEPSLDKGCRLSYDPGLYFNPQAIALTLEQPLEMPAQYHWQTAPEEKRTAGADPWRQSLPGWEEEERLAFLFDVTLQETISQAESRANCRESEAFLIRLAENCFRSGIPEELAIKRIRFYSRLGENETRMRVMIRNAYRLEKGFGERSVVPPVQLLALQMDEFMKRRYELRRNLLKKTVEYKERAALFARFHPVNEEALNTISMQAHLEGLNFWDRDVKRYVCSNRIPLFNPLEDYLSSLPAWDGRDHIRMLSDSLPTDHPHWTLCFYRWFLGMVAQWKGLNRMHANCLVPLLSGEQSTGKSTWCKRILPPELQEYYSENLDMTTRRNAELTLNRFALINLDEFDSIPENKQPLLKHLLQLPEVTTKRPYGQHTEVLSRYASFIATCNPLDILTDPTGSRRFLCVEVKSQIQYEQFIDYPQLYAQAIAALRNGERYWPDRQEELLITGYNEAFARMSPEEQYLLTHYQPADETDDSGEWFSPVDLLSQIQQIGKIKSNRTTLIAFGRILRKHHFPRKHTSRGNLYKAKRVEDKG